MTCGIAKRHSGKLVILLLAIAFLGHDMLMAGDAHARPDASAGEVHTGHGQAAMTDSSRGAGQRAIASQSGPDQDSGIDACSTMRQLVQRPGTPLHLDAELTTGTVGLPVETSTPAVDHWWREPTAPPEVVRALFQVFLM